VRGRAQAAEARAAAERRAAPLLARLAPSPGPCLVVPGGFERERVRPGRSWAVRRVSPRRVHGLVVLRGAECEPARRGSRAMSLPQPVLACSHWPLNHAAEASGQARARARRHGGCRATCTLHHVCGETVAHKVRGPAAPVWQAGNSGTSGSMLDRLPKCAHVSPVPFKLAVPSIYTLGRVIRLSRWTEVWLNEAHAWVTADPMSPVCARAAARHRAGAPQRPAERRAVGAECGRARVLPGAQLLLARLGVQPCACGRRGAVRALRRYSPGLPRGAR
jgi:hypothetical protein